MFTYLCNLFYVDKMYNFEIKNKDIEYYHNIFMDNDELKHLLIDDIDRNYLMVYNKTANKLNHLQKCVLLTNQYPFINNYIQKYLNLYPDIIDYQNSIGYTALMIACLNCKTLSSVETIKILLDNSASLNIKDNNGNTALILSIFKNNNLNSEEAIMYLLEKNANVNLKNKYGCTALTYAIKYNHNNIFNMLMLQNPNLYLKDKYKWSYLFYAVYSNNYDMTLKLLQLNLNVNERNIDSCTPLMYACSISNSYIIAKLLIDNGAYINAKNNINFTALMYVCQYSNENIVRLLLQNNADINIINHNFHNALSISCFHSDNPKIVELLINSGADVNFTLNDNTKIISLLEENDIDIIKILLKYNASLDDIKDKKIRKKVKSEIFNNYNNLVKNINTCDKCSLANIIISPCNNNHKICITCFNEDQRCKICLP